MTLFWRGWITLFLLGVLASSPSRAWAAEPPASVHKIGVVNLDKVLQQYERTKASDSQLEEFSKAKEAEWEKRVAEIKQMKEELPLLNEEARAKRGQEIEEKMKSLAAFDRARKEAFKDKRDEAIRGILDEIEKTVTAYAKENDVELILSERAVLYGIETLDMSDQILTILNERYTKKKS